MKNAPSLVQKNQLMKFIKEISSSKNAFELKTEEYVKNKIDAIEFALMDILKFSGNQETTLLHIAARKGHLQYLFEMLRRIQAKFSQSIEKYTKFISFINSSDSYTKRTIAGSISKHGLLPVLSDQLFSYSFLSPTQLLVAPKGMTFVHLCAKDNRPKALNSYLKLIENHLEHFPEQTTSVMQCLNTKTPERRTILQYLYDNNAYAQALQSLKYSFINPFQTLDSKSNSGLQACILGLPTCENFNPESQRDTNNYRMVQLLAELSDLNTLNNKNSHNHTAREQLVAKGYTDVSFLMPSLKKLCLSAIRKNEQVHTNFSDFKEANPNHPLITPVDMSGLVDRFSQLNFEPKAQDKEEKASAHNSLK